MEQFKLKSSKQILEPSFPPVPPERGESDYRESRILQKCVKVLPNWDTARNSVEFNLTIAKEELREAEIRLKESREVAKTMYLTNNKKWASLRHKQEHLKESFIKFDKFVRENEFKRERARKKIEEEIAMLNQRKKMTKDIQEQYKKLLDSKIAFEQKIKEYRIYDDYLNSAVSLAPDQFKNTSDIIKRYQSLIETKQAVLEKRARELDELYNAKAALTKLIDTRMLELMSLNSKTVDLICRHDKARSRALLWESVVSEIKNISESKAFEVQSVKLAIYNIFKHMCARRDVNPQISRSDLEGQLAFIKKTLLDIKRTAAMAKQRLPSNERLRLRQKGVPVRSSTLPRRQSACSTKASSRS